MKREATDALNREVVSQLTSRKDFLRMAGAAGLGAALGSTAYRLPVDAQQSAERIL